MRRLFAGHLPPWGEMGIKAFPADSRFSQGNSSRVKSGEPHPTMLKAGRC
jgi:hypothetical protein